VRDDETVPRWPGMDESKQCTATANRTGKRCTRARMPGATVCSKHGGSIVRVKEAAERRVADTEAREVARRIDVDVSKYDGNPFAALRDLLRRDQIELERFARLVDRLEDSELVYTTRSGAEQIRAALLAYRDERDALGRRLDLMLRAGVAQRMAEVREAQYQADQTGMVSVFKFCVTMLRQDVSSALADAGAFGQHDEVMEKLQRRIQFRLANEGPMIITQLQHMAARGDGPART